MTYLASEIGPLLDLPRWVRDISPLTRVPTLRGGEVAVALLLVMLAIASALVARACSPYVAGTWRSAERVKQGGPSTAVGVALPQ